MTCAEDVEPLRDSHDHPRGEASDTGEHVEDVIYALAVGTSRGELDGTSHHEAVRNEAGDFNSESQTGD